MNRLVGLALLSSTAVYPMTAIAQDVAAPNQPLSWQEMNDCQRLVAFAEKRPAEAPMSAEDALNFEAQNDLASCTQAVGEFEPTLFAEFQQEYEAEFAQQQQAAGEATAVGGTGAAVITVEQAAPEVVVTQPEVTVTQAPPQILIRQQAPTITIQQPPPEIVVRMPELDVAIDVEQPRVSFQGDESVAMVEQTQP